MPDLDPQTPAWTQTPDYPKLLYRPTGEVVCVSSRAEHAAYPPPDWSEVPPPGVVPDAALVNRLQQAALDRQLKTQSAAWAAQPPPHERTPMAETPTYPRWRYHRDGRAVLVETPEAEAALAGEWADSPAAYGVMTAPSEEDVRAGRHLPPPAEPPAAEASATPEAEPAPEAPHRDPHGRFHRKGD